MEKNIGTARVLLTLLVLVIATGASSPLRPQRSQATLPNIVIILADDLGYGDTGIYNRKSKIPTPNIDRLAGTGIRYTDAHSPSSVCTPTRYALLTGRYAWRTEKKTGVLRPWDPPLIEAGRLTMPEMLRQQGYTTAIIGKWHLGLDWPTSDGKPPVTTSDGGSNVDFSRPIANGPITRGFDYFYGPDVPNYPPYVFIENDRTVVLPTETAKIIKGKINRPGPMAPGWDPVAIMPALNQRVVRYIDDAARAAPVRPFFLYLSLTAPHYPVAPAPEFSGKSRAGDYGDFVAQVDATVGDVMAALKRTGLDKNTLLVFTSDNGPEIIEVEIGAYERIPKYGHYSMGQLRGVKRDIWEGGHRVPFIASWPGRIPAGKVSNDLISHVDMMATAASITAAPIPENAAEDSFNMLPLLTGKNRKRPVRESLVHHSINGELALRKGEWVYLASKKCGDTNSEPEWFRKERGAHACNDHGALYRLNADISEKRNLYRDMPEKVAELGALLEKYVSEGRSAPRMR